MAFSLKVPMDIVKGRENFATLNGSKRWDKVISRKGRSASHVLSMSKTPVQSFEKASTVSHNTELPIMVNGCAGKMGKAVIEAAVSAGLHIVPRSFSSSEESQKTVQVGGKEIQMYGRSERESILASTFEEYPNLVVVDYTVPAAGNGH